jgi:glycolate oxidase iron-sulfur subunit
MSPLAELAREEARILACVHCGFCLDVCPTYTRLSDEADSPRGRIYMIRAVAEGRLDPGSGAFAHHIDRCLGCRACEPICPSGVQYGHLLERARATIAEHRKPRLLDRMLLRIFGTPALNRLAGWAGRLLRAGGFARRLARIVPGRPGFALRMLDATRPAAPWRTRPAGATAGPSGAPTAAGPGGEIGYPPVAVLAGCVQRSLFERVNRATERVLRANGQTIADVPGQRCCGALHAHAGDLAGARRLARANVRAFEAVEARAIVVNAAGCGAFMKSYGELFEGDPIEERARAVATRVRDVSELLLELGPARGAPVPLRVAYDAPCHLIHGQGLGYAPTDVLRAVPGLEVVRIAGAEECCGGAGTWGLAHPELGGQILDDKVRSIVAASVDAVVTPNPGCIMQIAAGLGAAGIDTPVLHPIELLDASYHVSGTGDG